jgi:hypothetical protein
MDNKKLPKQMYMAYHEDLGWFYSSCSEFAESAIAEVLNYTGIDFNKVTARLIEVKEV